MDSLVRIIIALTYFIFIFAGTIYIYQFDQGLALLFNMACLGVICSYLASKKCRSIFGWFFVGLFTGVLGVGAIMGLKTKCTANENI
jgi:hypothetical protein